MIILINVLLYFLFFLFVKRKNKIWGVCELLLLVYVIVAALCASTYYRDPLSWHLYPNNFLYLFLVIMLFFIPLVHDNRISVIVSPLNNKVYSWYKTFTFFYIVVSLYSCVVYLPNFILALTSPDWATLYDSSHEIKASNIFTKVANLFFHLRYLGLVLFFSYLSNKKEKTLFLTFLGIAAFFPLIIVTVSNASRGGVLRLSISAFLSYVMFKQILSRKVKKFFYAIFVTCVPLALLFFWAVSFSRFDASYYYDSTNDSLLYYAGHSMLCFCYGVMDTINGFAGGGYMFDTFGNFDSWKEINKTAEGLKAEGDRESLYTLAAENGLTQYDVDDYMDGVVDEFCTAFTAAIGKLKIEKEDLKLYEIMNDWEAYIEILCSEDEKICLAVRKKKKTLVGCIGALLTYSWKQAKNVDERIKKAAGVTGTVKLGIPSMGTAKRIIREYYGG